MKANEINLEFNITDVMQRIATLDNNSIAEIAFNHIKK
jgi:hypothetical protein